MCYHTYEVSLMDTENRTPQQQEEPYVPRPAWQVWAARIGLVIFVVGLILYYVNVMGGGR